MSSCRATNAKRLRDAQAAEEFLVLQGIERTKAVKHWLRTGERMDSWFVSDRFRGMRDTEAHFLRWCLLNTPIRDLDSEVYGTDMGAFYQYTPKLPHRQYEYYTHKWVRKGYTDDHRGPFELMKLIESGLWPGDWTKRGDVE